MTILKRREGCYVNACRDHLGQNNLGFDQNHHHDQSNCGRNYGSRLQPAGCKRPSTSSGLEHSSQLCNRSSDQVMLPFKSLIPFGVKIPLHSNLGNSFTFPKFQNQFGQLAPPNLGQSPFFWPLPKSKVFFPGRLPKLWWPLLRSRRLLLVNVFEEAFFAINKISGVVEGGWGAMVRASGRLFKLCGSLPQG